MSPLESCGKPLFFKVADSGDTGVRPPLSASRAGFRTVARSLALMQKEALVSSPTGQVWRLASDEGAYLMGDDIAPCPLSFMTVGMIASFMEHILIRLRQKGIELRGLRLIQDNYYTMEGSAIRGTMIGGALPVELKVEAESFRGIEDPQGLIEEAIAASPVSALLCNVLLSRFTLTHNGSEIPVGKVSPAGVSSVPFPGTAFDKALPAVGDWSGLVRKNGMTPKTSEATSSAGSSYASEQSRRLHLRGICSLRPDGVKSIEQQLFNPHGSVFHFLSEEGTDAGGSGRAPDALTYLSAGIAFCFMTQFGRYAKITGKQLFDYKLVQDTGFHPATPVRSAEADAVETHVHLDSGENEEFSRTILDMSEQTCFLHALCRSELNVRTTLSASESSATIEPSR